MMTEAPQPPTDPKPEDVHHFDYRHVGDSKKARVKARDEQLRGNPEWLYEHDERDGVISSLIFCTLHREEWIDAICEYYPGAVRGKTKKGDTKINLGKKRGSIIVFESGKFLILGSCDLEYFKEGFEDMKKDAMSRVNNTETADDDCDMAEAPQTSTNSKPEVVHEFDFTNVRNGKKPRTKARGEQLRVNPDRLYKQDARHGVIGSLIFYTEHREEWIASIRGYYRGTVREKTQKGDTNIKLGKGRGSIIAYKNGTFFMSGRLGMALFIQKFGAMKRDVMIRVKQNLNRQAPQSSTEPKPITAFKLLSEMEEEVLQFDFKEVQKKPEARLKARDDQLRANTDRLYENIRRRGEISSVIFYTKHTKEWEGTILKHNPEAKKKGNKIDLGWCLITMHDNGNIEILVQYNLEKVLQMFEDLKKDVPTEDMSKMCLEEKKEDCEPTRSRAERGGGSGRGGRGGGGRRVKSRCERDDEVVKEPNEDEDEDEDEEEEEDKRMRRRKRMRKI